MKMCSNSIKKMEVKATKNLPFATGKRWVRVKFAGTGQEWIPSFEDLHRIVQAICHCEDEKYPNGLGRGMVAQFLVDAVYETDFNNLAKSYKIPQRCGDKVINSNGAAVDGGSNGR